MTICPLLNHECEKTRCEWFMTSTRRCAIITLATYIRLKCELIEEQKREEDDIIIKSEGTD